jgi:hypothetical protein
MTDAGVVRDAPGVAGTYQMAGAHLHAWLSKPRLCHSSPESVTPVHDKLVGAWLECDVSDLWLRCEKAHGLLEVQVTQAPMTQYQLKVLQGF